MCCQAARILMWHKEVVSSFVGRRLHVGHHSPAEMDDPALLRADNYHHPWRSPAKVPRATRLNHVCGRSAIRRFMRMPFLLVVRPFWAAAFLPSHHQVFFNVSHDLSSLKSKNAKSFISKRLNYERHHRSAGADSGTLYTITRSFAPNFLARNGSCNRFDGFYVFLMSLQA